MADLEYITYEDAHPNNVDVRRCYKTNEPIIKVDFYNETFDGDYNDWDADKWEQQFCCYVLPDLSRNEFKTIYAMARASLSEFKKGHSLHDAIFNQGNMVSW